MPPIYGSVRPKKTLLSIDRERKYFDSADYTMTGKTGRVHPHIKHYEGIPKSSLNICK